MKKFKFKKKNNYLIKVFILVATVIVTMSVGHALFSDTISINGTANANPMGSPECTITITPSSFIETTHSKTITINYAIQNIPSSSCLCEYSLDGGTTWNTYTGPFSIYQTTNIKARCLIAADSTLLDAQEKNVYVVMAYIQQYNGRNTLFGTSINKTTVTSIGRTTETLTEQDILDRINNGASIFLISNTVNDGYLSEAPIYGWVDSNGKFNWWSEADEVYFHPNTLYGLRNIYNAVTIDITGMNTSKVVSFSNWFRQDSYNVTKFTTLIGQVDTSSATTADYMFYDCMELTAIDTTKFNTSGITNMNRMFSTLRSMTSLDVSMFDTSNVTSMEWMFRQTGVHVLDLSSFDTSNVTNMFGMFVQSYDLQEVIFGPDFDTSNVQNFGNMFYECKNLTTIYTYSDFDTSSKTNDSNMFLTNSVLVGGNGTSYTTANVKNSTYAKIDRAGVPGYFTDINSQTNGTNNTNAIPGNGLQNSILNSPLQSNLLNPASINQATSQSTSDATEDDSDTANGNNDDTENQEASANTDSSTGGIANNTPEKNSAGNNNQESTNTTQNTSQGQSTTNTTQTNINQTTNSTTNQTKN